MEEQNMDEQLRKLKENMTDKDTQTEDTGKEAPEDGMEQTEVSVKEEKEEKPKGKKTSRRGSNVKALEMEIEKQKEIAAEYQDKYKRLLAEFENARNREAKEATKMYDIGAKEVLEKLLPVVDNFERALQTIPEEDKERAFEQGVDKIYKQLMVSLEELGVEPMNAEGKEFNPDLHNAVLHIEDETLDENVVVEEMQKGYLYKEMVLRYSMVKVAN